MLFDKWHPVFAPEVETGTGQDDAQVTTPPGGGTGTADGEADGPGSGRSGLRKQLEKNFESDRQATDRETQRNDRRAKGRFARGTGQEGEGEAGTQATEGQTEGQAAEEQQQGYAAPEAWSREAKAEFANLPDVVQAAIAKREQDGTKGVQELKDKYAEIDAVMKPRHELIKRFNKTPAQAIDQMWSWFEALAANPQVAFPALAHSFNFDLRRVLGEAQQAQQGQQTQQGQQQAAAAAQQVEAAKEIPGLSPELKAYLDTLSSQFQEYQSGVSQKIGTLESTFQQQSEAKTKADLDGWSQGKPYFQEVRTMMGQLIASGAVPLKNGRVDLDGAYDMALYALPEIRAKVLADQEATREKQRLDKAAAEAKAKQDQAEKARRANVSLAPNAPGTPAVDQKQQRKGKSVRESLAEAFEQTRA